MHEDIPAAEIYTLDEPFLIRAHHSRQLFQLLALGWPAEYVQDSAEEFAQANLSRRYNADAFGTGPDTSQAFRDNALAYYAEFLALPDDTPVRLVASQRDRICDGCAIGSHCDEWNKGDYAWIRAAKATAGELGLGEHVEEIEQVITRGGKDRTVPALNLSAGTARAVFADINYFSRTFPGPLQFLARLSTRRNIMTE